MRHPPKRGLQRQGNTFQELRVGMVFSALRGRRPSGLQCPVLPDLVYVSVPVGGNERINLASARGQTEVGRKLYQREEVES